MPFRRRANVLAGLILIAGTAILLGDVLRGSRVISDGDILDYYYPVKTLIRNLFLRGHSLVWNPFLGEGQPLAANPEHELFYPFTWLLFAAPVRVALALSAAAHLALSFAGMLRLLRRLRCSESAAIFGAVSWSFGGLLVSSIHLYPIVFAWTWIPWLCAAAARKSSTAATILQAGLFGGLILLVGEPVTALLGAAAFATVLAGREPRARRSLAPVAAAGVLALGLGAASWLPGLALAAKTVRHSGLPAAEAAARSFPPERLAEILVPNAFGDVRPHSFVHYLGWRFYSGSVWPFFWGIYAGALLLPLAFAGLVSRRRQDLVFGGIAALALAVSLGPRAGIWTLLRRTIPGADGIRFPEKFFALALFFGVILSARGWDRVRSRGRPGRLVAAAPIVVGVLLAVVASLPAASKPFAIRAVAPGALAGAALRHVALGSLLTLVVFRRRREFQARLVPLLVAAAATDILSASRALIGTRDAGWMDSPPPVVLQMLRVSPPPRLADFLPPEPPAGRILIEDKNGPFERNRVLFEQPVQWGIPLALDQDFDLTFIRAERRARHLVNRILLADHRAFGALLAARHVGALLLWKAPMTLDDPVTVAGVAGVRPETDSVDSLLTFRGDDDYVREVLDAKSDLRRTAFVENAAPFPAASLTPATLDSIEAGDLAVTFVSTAPGPSLTRVARTNDGNWRASVDGKPWPVLTVDISMIGIAIPPGRHQVELRYRDRWLETGIVVSALFVLLLIAAGVRTAARARAAPS